MSKPNIVFCHVDQLHYRAFSHLGNTFVSTPGLDEMAADGMTLNRAISANPVCCPARACWYTGRMSSENGVFWMGGQFRLRKDLPDLGQLLGEAGYDCYYGGKWHVTGRDQSSFKVIYPIIHQGECNDEALAATGEAFFKNYKGDKPFFLNLGFMNPHDCCYMFMDALQPAFKTGMEKFVTEAELPPLPPNYNAQIPMPDGGAKWTEDQLRLYIYTYYRMAETVDAAVSRVYRAFKASPFFENTVFIWSSDHGEMKAEQNLFGKGVPWEASQRVPLKVVSKGRIAPGSSDDSQWIGGTDVSATILDYAEAGPVPGTDIAKSFRGLLEGQPATAQDYVVSESSLPDAAVSFRSKDTKSIFHLQPGGQMTAEYYDTSQDPWEKNNLASGGAEPPGLADHRAFLADYRTRVKYLPAYLAGIESGGFLRVKPKRPAAASS